MNLSRFLIIYYVPWHSDIDLCALDTSHWFTLFLFWWVVIGCIFNTTDVTHNRSLLLSLYKHIPLHSLRFCIWCDPMSSLTMLIGCSSCKFPKKWYRWQRYMSWSVISGCITYPQARPVIDINHNVNTKWWTDM